MAEVIDARKSLGPAAIQKFKSGFDDDANVIMYIEETQTFFERPMKDLRKFFEDEEVEKSVPNDDCVICFIVEDRVLQIIGLDFNWWIAVVRNKKYRRLDKLFGDVEVKEKEVKKETSKKQDDKQVIKCAAGILSESIYNPEVTDIQLFEGAQKLVTAFINRAYQLFQIRSIFKAKVVFCVNYTDDSELLDLKNWLTMEELIEKGVFIK